MSIPLLGTHALEIKLLAGATTGSPAPAPAPTPLPPVEEPIAFSVIARDDLFGIVGAAISSTTLATVTCADDAMTIVVSETVPGLTFSYASKVLSVAGTPTTPTGVHRVFVNYMASSGAYAIRGSSIHTITIVSASEILTIGNMASVNVTEGVTSPSQTLCSPTTNYAVDVDAVPTSYAFGLDVVLAWTKATSTGSGVLTISGRPLPTPAPYPVAKSLTVDYYGNGVKLGTSTHTVTLNAPYSAPAPVPSPTPAPPAPSPTPPPAPTPAPQPGSGPDSLFSSVKVLMHFNDATGIATDVKGNTFRNFDVTSTTGAVAEGGSFNGLLTTMDSTIAGIDGSSANFAVECMVRIGQTTWDALTAAGPEYRFSPVLTASNNDDGMCRWMLGFYRFTGSDYIAAVFWRKVDGSPTGALAWLSKPIFARPDRFVHLAYGSVLEGASFARGAVWWDGRADLAATSGYNPTNLVASDPALLQIGGACPLIEWVANSSRYSDVIPFVGGLDEVRITSAARYAAYLAGSTRDLPLAARVIPWPNY